MVFDEGNEEVNPYTANKAILHADRLIALKEGKQPFPVHLHFDISDICNQACRHCAYRADNYTETFAEGDNHNPNRMYPVQHALRVLDDFKEIGGKAIQLTGGGEPTLHPAFNVILVHAQKLGLDTALVTNGVRMDRCIDQLMDCSWVRISIYSGSKEGYVRIRRCPESHWDTVISNIKELVRVRNERESKLTIGIGFVVTPGNWEEVVNCAALAKILGVDNMRISAEFQSEGYEPFKDFHGAATERCKIAENLSTEKFTVINAFPSRMSDLALGTPDYERCAYQHFTTYLGADENLYRCCVNSYKAIGLIGHVNEGHLAEWI